MMTRKNFEVHARAGSKSLRHPYLPPAQVTRIAGTISTATAKPREYDHV